MNMKKFIFLSIVAITAVSCSSNDPIREYNESEGNAIQFESYAQTLTRAENSTNNAIWVFFNHHNNFQIWGYKNTAANNKPVFEGDYVTVTEESTPGTYKYTNSTVRFWDKAATKYEFYAAAPYAENMWTFTPPTTTDQSDGTLATTSTLTGTNLQISSPSKDLKNSFKSAAGDVDKMIASPCPWTQIGSTVNLHFNHILSKMNISIRKAESLKEWKVTLKSFNVYNMKGTGSFNEAKATATTSGSIVRWNNDESTPSGSVTYTSIANWEIANGVGVENNSDYKYIIESLVIPQNINWEALATDGNARTTPSVINAASTSSAPYFVIEYTLQHDENNDNDFDDEDDFEENYKAYYNLAAAFGMDGTTDKTIIPFNEGWQNTLNITIQPDEINFDADVYQWAEYFPKTDNNDVDGHEVDVK